MKQNLTPEQEKDLLEFYTWVAENIVGYPDDGRPIPLPREFDEDTMMIVEFIGRIFVIEKDQIPERFLKKVESNNDK
jgi:hypothetical protein